MTPMTAPKPGDIASGVAAVVAVSAQPLLVFRWGDITESEIGGALSTCSHVLMVEVSDRLTGPGAGAGTDKAGFRYEAAVAIAAAAHEVAHHDLGHPAAMRREMRRVRPLLILGPFIGAYGLGHAGWQATASGLLIVLAGLAMILAGAGQLLVYRRRDRQRELDADKLGAELLGRAGLGGRAAMAASLQWIAGHVPQWYLRLSALSPFAAHPSLPSRIARLSEKVSGS